jgi:hypothetical protein
MMTTIMDYIRPIAKEYNLDNPEAISALIEAFREGVKLGINKETGLEENDNGQQQPDQRQVTS